MMITTEAFDAALASEAVGHSTVAVNGILYGAKMMLFTNDLTISKATVKADLTEPTYAGYAEAAITWTGPKRDGDGNVSLDSGLMPWQMGDNLLPTTIKGYGILNSAGSVLYAAEKFASDVPLVDTLSFLGVVAEFSTNNEKPGEATIVQ